MPKKKKFTKSSAIKIHAEKRKNERCPSASLSKIKKMICTKNATFIKKQSNRVSHFLVKVDEDEIIAVYDKKRKLVVTLLYPEGDENDNRPNGTVGKD